MREDSDLCAIESTRFFVRVVLPLAVQEQASTYHIGLWVKVELSTFQRVLELWSAEDQSNEPPCPALIANELPSLPCTLGLQASLQLTGPRSRPKVLLLPVEHPLYQEQLHGITAHRAYKYTSFVL